MSRDDEFDLGKQYRVFENRRAELADMEVPPAREFAWHLLNFCRFLVNHGESLKAEVNLISPKALAADFAQQALELANAVDHDLKAAAYLSIAEARWFFSSPPHQENAVLCEKALAEVGIWQNSPDGLDQEHERHPFFEQIAYVARESRALYLHYANDFTAAIDAFESLLKEKRQTGTAQECFSLSTKLANVLNDANRRAAARQLLFSLEVKQWAISDEQRFRLHVARSNCHALAGQMGDALTDIHAALRYFNASQSDTEKHGNLLIRAARYYIMLSAYEDAMTMLPDLIGVEDSCTGGEYQLNLAVVRSMLWLGHGNQEQATEALAKLEAMVSGVPEEKTAGQYPDQYWNYVALTAEFKRRYHGNHAAIAFIGSLPDIADSTIDTLGSHQYPVLLKYCEASVNAGHAEGLEPQMIALLCMGVFDNLWERWKAPFCAAKWFLLKGEMASAIFWLKLACSHVLSLSVPLLRSKKQRERVTEALMSPLVLLENTLCAAARIPEAQSIRAYRLYLECEMRFPHLTDKAYQVFEGIPSELKFSPEEAERLRQWDACADKAIHRFEQGMSTTSSIKSTGMQQLATSIISIGSEDSSVQRQQKNSQNSLSQTSTNSAHLSYWVAEDQLWLVVECGATRKELRLTISSQIMRQNVYQLRVAIEEGAEWLSLAAGLYESLIHPVARFLSGVETLIISTSDALRYLPMAALFDGSDYLVEKFKLVYSNTRLVNPYGYPMRRKPCLLVQVFICLARSNSIQNKS